MKNPICYSNRHLAINSILSIANLIRVWQCKIPLDFDFFLVIWMNLIDFVACIYSIQSNANLHLTKKTSFMCNIHIYSQSRLLIVSFFLSLRCYVRDTSQFDFIAVEITRVWLRNKIYEMLCGYHYCTEVAAWIER